MNLTLGDGQRNAPQNLVARDGHVEVVDDESRVHGVNFNNTTPVVEIPARAITTGAPGVIIVSGSFLPWAGIAIRSDRLSGGSPWSNGAHLPVRVVLTCLCVALLGSACGSSGAGGDESEARPNLVLIVLDDLDDTGAPYWDVMPKTRELIADRGVQFTNSFATDPMCCPARATILSGQYPHNNGVVTASDVNIPPDVLGGEITDGSAIEIFARDAEKRSIAVRLHESGYRTAFLGKYLNGYELAPDYVPPGWDEWFGLGGSFLDGYGYVANHNGSKESYGNDVADYQTDVLAQQAFEFLTNAEAEDADPFLLTLWPSAPHAPIGPAPRHEDNEFADDHLPTRPNFNEQDVSDKPSWLREGVPQLDAAGRRHEAERYRNGLGSLVAVDDMIAKLGEKLDENDELDDTVFIFTSDNGQNRGAHRLPQKMAPYEESIRVPLAIAGPNVPNGTEDRLVTHADVAPTLLDLAGVALPDELDGRSLLPLLQGSEPRWRQDFLVEFYGLYHAYIQLHTANDVAYFIDGGETLSVPSYRAVRSTDYLYVEWYGGDVHEYELYDLEADPYQLTNLLATPDGAEEYASTRAALQARLDELAVCAGASCH
jgi:N-acetylglucosamine-6-sulfatase